MKIPENEKLRHPPGVIDQRQQRIDPSNEVTRDPNANSDTRSPDPLKPRGPVGTMTIETRMPRRGDLPPENWPLT